MNLRSLFLHHIAQTSPAPIALEIERAEGMFLYPDSGPPLMDLISGIGVSVLGHRHPAVIEAITHQCARYLHTMVYGEMILRPQVLLAKHLAELLPSPLDSVYFTNSGTEAIEGAMKLAKKATGRHEIIACFDAYHGSTQGSMSLMYDQHYRTPFLPLLPGIRHIRYNDFADLEKITTGTAAVVMETIQAESGITVPRPGYLQAVAEQCYKTSTLLILDEIQCGLGRTGSMFAFEPYHIVPDILTLAKGLGGGMPIGAFISSQGLMSHLSHNPALGHITTFGGHPVSCAAALATLKTIQKESLLQTLPAKMQLFQELLPHPRLREIRQGGFWFALDLGDAKLVQQAVTMALEKGLLIDWFLFNDRSLRLGPPLIMDETHIREACRRLHQIFDAL